MDSHRHPCSRVPPTRPIGIPCGPGEGWLPSQNGRGRSSSIGALSLDRVSEITGPNIGFVIPVTEGWHLPLPSFPNRLPSLLKLGFVLPLTWVWSHGPVIQHTWLPTASQHERIGSRFLFITGTKIQWYPPPPT